MKRVKTSGTDGRRYMPLKGVTSTYKTLLFLKSAVLRMLTAIVDA